MQVIRAAAVSYKVLTEQQQSAKGSSIAGICRDVKYIETLIFRQQTSRILTAEYRDQLCRRFLQFYVQDVKSFRHPYNFV